MTQDPRPPFIADHRLIELVKKSDSATKTDQKAWLRPETFRWRREDDDRFQQAPDGLSETWAWEVVEDRTAFLTDLSPRLRAITVNAGVGKTMAAFQTQYLLQQQHSDHLCLVVNFSRMPEQAGDIWNDNPAQSELVNWFRAEKATVDAPRDHVAQLIAQKISAGKFTLVVEAFDQTTSGRDVRRQAEALQTFLYVNPTVRCVCTGRPHAIVDKFWRSLFEHDHWQFIQIDTFSKEQAKVFVGVDRWKLCKKLDATELFVPRSLEAVRGIKLKKLAGVRTASQVFWRCLQHTFEKALVTQNTDDFCSPDGSWEIKKHHALQLFAMLAFECNRQGLLDGVAAGKPFRKFVTKFFKRHQDHLKQKLDIDSEPKLEQMLTTLARLNAAIDFAALDHEGVTQVIFQNRTLQDFFAAVWMCTHASDKDRKWFARQKSVRWKQDTSTHHQMWKLATEMPDETEGNLVSRDDGLWIKMVRPLFAPSTPKQPTVRSTELTWRSWTTLERLAAGTGKTARAADGVLSGYQQEYRDLLAGNGSDSARSICEDFESWFVDIDPAAAVWSDGDMDVDGKPLPMVTQPYQMAKYTVTNEVYALFDENLGARYAGYTDFTGENSLDSGAADQSYVSRGRAPVVAIDWYDAWCFSRWVGGVLPTEVGWEYACRAGSRRRFSVGDGETLTEGDARFDQKWEALATEVDAFAAGNAWGLYQMHGNVWEWCENWFDADELFRCLRGGSFLSLPENCRSASRGRDLAGSSYHDLGVRVSRVAMK